MKNRKKELSRDQIVPLLYEREKELKEKLKEIEASLEKVPQGTIHTTSNKKSSQYYQVWKTEGKLEKKYLSKKKEEERFLIHMLLQKNYNKQIKDELQRELAAIQEMLSQYHPQNIEELYVGLAESKQQWIDPIILIDEDYIKSWEEEDYEKKEFWSSEMELYTAKGERVRSKSEIIIADTLNRFSVPYKYEKPIVLKGIGIVHPDFSCLNVQTRKEYIWEHFGMMSNSEYAEKTVKKIERYVLDGYLPGENFLMTFESEQYPLSTKAVEQIIKQYLL